MGSSPISSTQIGKSSGCMAVVRIGPDVRGPSSDGRALEAPLAFDGRGGRGRGVACSLVWMDGVQAG